MVDSAMYKDRLEQELAMITEELKTIGIHNPEVPADWQAIPAPAENEADPNLGADRVEDWDEKRAVLANLETRFNDVRRALEKISAGTYGVCEISGAPIEADRLAANPAARTCKAHLNDEVDLPMN
jgi:DnaK suppressor protein